MDGAVTARRTRAEVGRSSPVPSAEWFRVFRPGCRYNISARTSICSLAGVGGCRPDSLSGIALSLSRSRQTIRRFPVRSSLPATSTSLADGLPGSSPEQPAAATKGQLAAPGSLDGGSRRLR